MSKRGTLIAFLLILVGLAIVTWFWLLPSPADRPPESPPQGESRAEPEPSSEGAVPQLPPGSNPDVARRFKRTEAEPAATSGDFQVRGFVTNIRGAALTGAKISLAATCEDASALVSTATDSIGFYQVRFRNAGDDIREVCLRVERAGYNPVSEWIEPKLEWQKRDFSLTPASATLRGRVADPRGKGLPRAFVQIAFRPDYSVYRNVGSNVFTTSTDAAGRYRFRELPLGRVQINASKDGFQGEYLSVELAADEDAFLDFEFLPLHRHKLTVVGPDGQPVDSASLSTPEQGTFPARGEEPIDFQIAGKEGSAPVPCRVSAPGYLSAAVDLDPLDPVKVVVLQPAPPLRGRVVTEDGKPVPWASATVTVPYREGSLPDPPARTDSDGAFLLRPSNRPVLGIRVIHQAYAETELVFPCDPGDEVEVVLKPSNTGLQGRFVDSAGEPFPFFGVTLSRETIPHDRHESFASGDGSFRVLGLEEGLYRITFHGFAEDRLETAVIDRVPIAQGRVAGPILAVGSPVDPEPVETTGDHPQR